jgi:hypothetical protein
MVSPCSPVALTMGSRHLICQILPEVQPKDPPFLEPVKRHSPRSSVICRLKQKIDRSRARARPRPKCRYDLRRSRAREWMRQEDREREDFEKGEDLLYRKGKRCFRAISLGLWMNELPIGCHGASFPSFPSFHTRSIQICRPHLQLRATTSIERD